jgi:hypothetical protein
MLVAVAEDLEISVGAAVAEAELVITAVVAAAFAAVAGEVVLLY